jgi:hypothetical protein
MLGLARAGHTHFPALCKLTLICTGERADSLTQRVQGFLGLCMPSGICITHFSLFERRE